MNNYTSLKEFTVIRKIGDGSFSSVYKVKRNSDSKIYALKKVNFEKLSRKEKENAVNEVRILASVSNKNIISYKEVFIDEDSSLCVIMEYASGGDLLNFLSSFIKEKEKVSEIEIWKIIVDILNGIKALHDMKIVHRDIKLANIFITEEKIYKIGDLNVSKQAKQGLLFTQTGTPYYASPEVWRDEPYNQKSDIWSFGCVIYELCNKTPPFSGNNMAVIYEKVQKGIYPPLVPCYSNELAILVRVCLQVNPAKRPNASKVLASSIITKKNFLQETEEPEKTNNLLSTIKVPRSIKGLKSRLPGSQYNSNHAISFDKETEELKEIPRKRIHSYERNQSEYNSPHKELGRIVSKMGISDYKPNVNPIIDSPLKVIQEIPIENKSSYRMPREISPYSHLETLNQRISQLQLKPVYYRCEKPSNSPKKPQEPIYVSRADSQRENLNDKLKEIVPSNQKPSIEPTTRMKRYQNVKLNFIEEKLNDLSERKGKYKNPIYSKWWE